MGVAGQALDTHGSPITGLLVKITGKLDGNPVDMIAMTGTETLYGDGGFELTLADHPFDSRGELHIQLLDNSLLPLSAPYDLDLTGDCKMNLNLLNFRQVRE
jgi:hypothetical protein